MICIYSLVSRIYSRALVFPVAYTCSFLAYDAPNTSERRIMTIPQVAPRLM